MNNIFLPRTARVRVIKSHTAPLRPVFICTASPNSLNWAKVASTRGKFGCNAVTIVVINNPVRVKYFPRQETARYRTPMGYHHPRQTNPFPEGNVNVQGMTPSSPDSSISNAVQAANNLRALAIITRGLHVHTHTSHLFKLAIQR